MSANRAIAFKPPRKPAGAFFHWDAPDVPIAVHFHMNVIDVLEGLATRATKKGTAGILLGRIENGQRPTLIIEDSEPVPIAPNRAATDTPFRGRAWDSMLARWQSKPEKRISIVGFYRSGSTGQNALDANDLAVLKANSTDSEKIFLHIEPHVDSPTSGFLFMAPNGVQTFEWNEIPFNRSELTKKGTASETQNAERPNSESEIEIRRPQLPEIDRSSERPVAVSQSEGLTRLQWALGGAALAAILIVAMISLSGGQMFHSSSAGKQSSEDSPLGLKTQRSGTDLQVSWDRKSPLLLNATAGQLSIMDGSLLKTVDLGVSELRSGTISYAPVTDDVALRLDVVDEKLATVITETVRVIGGASTVVPSGALGGLPSPRINSIPPSLPAPQRKPGTPASSPRSSTKGNGDAPVDKQADKRTNTQVNKSSETQVDKQSEKQAGPQALAATAPPADAKVTPSSSSTAFRTTPDQRERGELVSVSVPITTVSEPNASSSIFPSASELLGKESASNTESSETRSVSKNIPGRSEIEPAKMISSREPQYPAFARQLRISGDVRVTFRVGADGKVKSVTSVTGPDALRQAVVDVVKAQRYTPARLDGEPTETEVSMVYTFKLN